jgi:hypothetical protein
LVVAAAKEGPGFEPLPKLVLIMGSPRLPRQSWALAALMIINKRKSMVNNFILMNIINLIQI